MGRLITALQNGMCSRNLGCNSRCYSLNWMPIMRPEFAPEWDHGGGCNGIIHPPNPAPSVEGSPACPARWWRFGGRGGGADLGRWVSRDDQRTPGGARSRELTRPDPTVLRSLYTMLNVERIPAGYCRCPGRLLKHLCFVSDTVIGDQVKRNPPNNFRRHRCSTVEFAHGKYCRIVASENIVRHLF